MYEIAVYSTQRGCRKMSAVKVAITACRHKPSFGGFLWVI